MPEEIKEDKYGYKDEADNMIKILEKLNTCLVNSPESAGPEGLTLMGIALILKKVAGFNVFADVRAFNQKMGIVAQGGPWGHRHLSGKAQHFRDKLLKEEFNEYKAAVEAKDLEKQFDGLIDIIYICAGTIAMHGWNGEEAWRRVHAANMKKEPALAPTIRAGDTGQIDVVKPSGWKHPVLSDLV